MPHVFAVRSILFDSALLVLPDFTIYAFTLFRSRGSCHYTAGCYLLRTQVTRLLHTAHRTPHVSTFYVLHVYSAFTLLVYAFVVHYTYTVTAPTPDFGPRLRLTLHRCLPSPRLPRLRLDYHGCSCLTLFSVRLRLRWCVCCSPRDFVGVTLFVLRYYLCVTYVYVAFHDYRCCYLRYDYEFTTLLIR